MKEYNNIYQSATAKADAELSKASSSATSAKIANKKLEELTGLVATQIAEKNKFKNFEEKYNNLLKNEKVSKILGREDNDAWSVYNSGTVSISDGVSVRYQDIEALSVVDALKNELNLKSVIKDFFK